MKKIRKSIAEIKDEIYDVLGGITGAVKYYKRHPSAFYPDYFKMQPQPLVQNNVNVANVATVSSRYGDARQQLLALLDHIISAKQASIGDPAVYVNDERLLPITRESAQAKLLEARVNPQLNFSLHDLAAALDDEPSTDDARPATDDASPGTADDGDVSGSNSEKLKSPNQGPLSPQSGVATTSGATSPGGGTKQKSHYSNSTGPLPRISIPGLASGAALDGSDDNRSTTQRFLEWNGHGRPP
jgi:hypothetical protein